MKRFFCLAIALHCAAAGYSQSSSDTVGTGRNLVLDEFILNDKGLKRYTNKLPSEDGRWYWLPGDEANLATADSSFNLMTVPVLGKKRVRIREIRLKLRAWDTGKMRINLMVMQFANGDTNFTIRRLPMNVRKNWLRLRVEDLGFELASDAFFVGISLAAARISRPCTYRFFASWAADNHLALVRDGKLTFPPKMLAFAIPLEIGFDEF